MLHRKINLLPCLVVLGFCVTAAVAVGQETVATNQLTETVLSASLQNGELIGSEPVRRAFVQFGTNEFAFVMPPEFRLDASNPEKLVLVKSDYTCFINLRIMRMGTASSAPPKPETLRGPLLSRYPSARILEEFNQSAANQTGPAFDLQFRSAAGMLQSARIAYIPCAAGLIEFTLVANADQFVNGQYAFSSLLLTFCTNEGGKLEIVPLSDKS